MHGCRVVLGFFLLPAASNARVERPADAASGAPTAHTLFRALGALTTAVSRSAPTRNKAAFRRCRSVSVGGWLCGIGRSASGTKVFNTSISSGFPETKNSAASTMRSDAILTIRRIEKILVGRLFQSRWDSHRSRSGFVGTSAGRQRR
jgi:hypothetical protein